MASPSTSWSTYQFFLSSLLILIFVFLLSIAYHFFIARRNRAHVAGPLSPPPATALKAGTPPRLPHGLATICSTFSLGGTGTVSEPNAPVYNAPRIPLDLTNRQYAHAATTDAALAVRLLNLETEQVLLSVGAWHQQRGTSAVWQEAIKGVRIAARRSSLSALWGMGGDSPVLRVRRRAGIVYLDRAHRVTQGPRPRKGQTHLYGRRFEVAVTQCHKNRGGLGKQRGSDIPLSQAQCFMAAVSLALPTRIMLLTEVDCVACDSFLAPSSSTLEAPACTKKHAKRSKASQAHSSAAHLGSSTASPNTEAMGAAQDGLGVYELKSRTCDPKSDEFAVSAKGIWAQSMLGAVERVVLGVRAAGKLARLHYFSQAQLVEAVQRVDPRWTPEDALGDLDRRLQFVLAHAVDGADREVSTHTSAAGTRQLQVRDKNQLVACLALDTSAA